MNHRDNPAASRQPARIVGILDTICASDRSFTLQLPDGQRCHGLLVRGTITSLARFFGSNVLAFGKAVFDASGAFVCIEADEIVWATKKDWFFACVPESRLQPLALSRIGEGKGGVAAIIGKWPGDESDEQMREILREID